MEILLKLFDIYEVVRDYIKACKNMEFVKILYKKDKNKAKSLLKEMFLDDELVKELQRSLDA
jgi:hypothetical protein